jgi:hypothetical protein
MNDLKIAYQVLYKQGDLHAVYCSILNGKPKYRKGWQKHVVSAEVRCKGLLKRATLTTVPMETRLFVTLQDNK